MAKTRARTRFTPKLITVAVAACFATSAAFANPTGPTVVNGTASFQQTANLLQITNSPNAIINWQSFSIGASEITRFLQQSASSAVLNRVIAQNPSSILGALQSNGRVFLINPNGILFGAGAQIDVAGLVASSLNLSNADFLAGKLKFTEVPGAGSVINEGTINAAQGGSVYLVGPSVTNSGVITTPKGEVILAAGNSVELVNPGTPNLRVEITAPDNEAINLGQIVADSGRVGIYAGLINHSGTIRADSAQVTDSGQIVLKATKNVTLEPTSVISASGAKGGEIFVLADTGTVDVAGRLDASAPNGGDGGFIETSGAKVKIDSGAIITTSAPYGKTGTWLIDPPDFRIGLLVTDDITGAGLSALLNADTTDIVISSDGGEGGVNGDIFVNDPVAWAANRSLTLTARRDVNVNSGITSTGGGTVGLNAGWDGISPAATPTVTSGTGTIRVDAPISVTDAADIGRDATIKLTAGGGITVSSLVEAKGGLRNNGNGGKAEIKMTAGAGGITIQNLSGGGSCSDAGGGVFACGGNGQTGGQAIITLNTTGGIMVGNITGDGGLVLAEGGFGNNGGGGKAEITMTAGADGIAIRNSSSFVSCSGSGGVIACGGSGKTGGQAIVTLNTTGGITVENNSLVLARGGSGSGGPGGNGGNAEVKMTAGSAGIEIRNSANSAGSCSDASAGVLACGGFGQVGGSAMVTLTTTSPIVVDNSTIEAFGGNGGTNGGSATVMLTGNGITVGSLIRALGGSGIGADATVMLNAGTGTIQINSGTVEAECPTGVSEIRLSFLNRASGGFFVTGQEGVVFNPPTGTGFLVERSPAIPGVNFLVTYSGSPPTPPPPDLIDQVVVANDLNFDILSDQLRGGEAGEGAPEEKKRELPVCR